MEVFNNIRLICPIADDNGRVYPYSNAATSVLDALRFAADSSGIRTCDFTVFEQNQTRFYHNRRRNTGKSKACNHLPQAAPSLGSSGEGYELCRSLGHSVTRLFPALAPVRTDIELVKSLKGLRVAADATLISGEG